MNEHSPEGEQSVCKLLAWQTLASKLGAGVAPWTLSNEDLEKYEDRLTSWGKDPASYNLFHPRSYNNESTYRYPSAISLTLKYIERLALVAKFLERIEHKTVEGSLESRSFKGVETHGLGAFLGTRLELIFFWIEPRTWSAI